MYSLPIIHPDPDPDPQNWEALELRTFFIHSYILQANEQNIIISIKQTQTQPQYSMPHGQRRVVTPPLTRNQILGMGGVADTKIYTPLPHTW